MAVWSLLRISDKEAVNYVGCNKVCISFNKQLFWSSDLRCIHLSANCSPAFDINSSYSWHDFICGVNCLRKWFFPVRRMGSYELGEAENVQRGTKVVIHLKGDSHQFSKDEAIKGIEFWLALPFFQVSFWLKNR